MNSCETKGVTARVMFFYSVTAKQKRLENPFSSLLSLDYTSISYFLLLCIIPETHTCRHHTTTLCFGESHPRSSETGMISQLTARAPKAAGRSVCLCVFVCAAYKPTNLFGFCLRCQPAHMQYLRANNSMQDLEEKETKTSPLAGNKDNGQIFKIKEHFPWKVHR